MFENFDSFINLIDRPGKEFIYKFDGLHFAVV